MALEMYNEAKKDLNEILKLEPNNKQAKLDMEIVNNKMKQVGRIYYVNTYFCNNLLTKGGVNYYHKKIIIKIIYLNFKDKYSI